eukprot:6931024-Pyramimonas_sp.AAC.1
MNVGVSPKLQHIPPLRCPAALSSGRSRILRSGAQRRTELRKESHTCGTFPSPPRSSAGRRLEGRS